MDPMTVLDRVDLQWTMHVDRVWRDVAYHVPGFHDQLRERVASDVEALVGSEDADSPLGIVLTGEAGAGKTHLLGSIRAACTERDAYFVLVDMTDVRDFWETALLGYLKSLQRPTRTAGQQFRRVLAELPGWSIDVEELAALRPPRLINVTDKLIGELGRGPLNQPLLEHRDVLRALVLLASTDMQIQSVGFDWLQATGVSDDQLVLQGFSKAQSTPRSVVRGLSWLMSLSHPTVLTLDQLDAIVAEHNVVVGVNATHMAPELSARVRLSESIIQGIGRGLLELRDTTSRTVTVVSSLQATWDILKKTCGRMVVDRYRAELNLRPTASADLARLLVERRLAASFQKLGYSPPYPSWPFRPHAFETTYGWTPRTLLKACDAHRRLCLAEGRVVELDRFLQDGTEPPPPPLPLDIDDIDREYAALAGRADATALLSESREDELGDLVGRVLLLLPEQYATPNSMDLMVEDQFAGRQSFEPLHARIRLVDHAHNDREEHLSVRVLQRSHHLAFQARLRAAITESGVDAGIEFRKLVVLRESSVPGGKVSQELIVRLKVRGGVMRPLGAEDVRRLWALEQLAKSARSGWRAWLRERRPIDSIPALKFIGEWLVALLEGKRPGSTIGPAPVHATEGKPQPKPTTDTKPTSEPKPRTEAKAIPAVPGPDAARIDRARLPVGRRLIGKTTTEPVVLELGSLVRHLAVLAGAGSGKTVFVRRLVEEAALRGIPAAVIDVANDLSMLGQSWPERPAEWTDDDDALARDYQRTVAVRVFTPGVPSGDAVRLEPLPDFAGVRDVADELEGAVKMAVDTLRPLAVQGHGHAGVVQDAILVETLRHFARHHQGQLKEYVDLLSDLPPEIVPGFQDVTKQARKMSETLRARMITDPLLQAGGTPLDPAVLFRCGKDGRTPVSVFNLAGLGSLENQQSFVNQLTMMLFTWVKKHPLSGTTGLGGLLVIDEAKDFVPANRPTVCSQSIIRGAAQFRKYGVGMIVATQEPKSIDHKIIANCSSHAYGRANSPAAIDVVHDLIRQHGGTGDDVAKLGTGQFYMHGELHSAGAKLAAATKIQTALCLTHHPKSPPSPDWVAAEARRLRKGS